MSLLTVKELAAELKVSDKTIYQWVSEGQIPCLRLPKKTVRFDRNNINEWLSSCKKEPDSGYNPVSRLGARKGGKQ